ncbi:hypothetical protein B6U90_03440 [Thermoplasmatales archaeon ex4484_6]|nr:MAG: hypothetical protein B6U90_03440 [Thermoplasmatales archaeon ex4484_6]RLF65428.1 MAG: hypothetical protein DRN57_09130 [Thermoplasmata archaeon]
MVRSFRRRYIVFHIVSPDNVGKGLLIKMIRDRTRSLDEEEFSRIKPWLVYHNDDWAILRCGHTGVAGMISILRSMDGAVLKEGKLHIRVAGVSGTLRGAFRKYVPEKIRAGRHYREER